MAHGAAPYRAALPGLMAMRLHTTHSFPRHAHDHFGIGVMTAGAQRSWSGRGAVESARGDIITVNPGEMHDGAPVRGAPRGWNILYLEPALLQREPGLENAEFAQPALRDAELKDLLDDLFGLFTDGHQDALAEEEALLRTLMLALRRHGARPPAMPGAPPGISAARNRLDAAPETPVTLAELAELAGLSRFQLLRGFAREFGVTPHAYLMQRRVRQVQQLLAAGHGPADAALRAGFADQSHMTRIFRRQLGITPSRYRAAMAPTRSVVSAGRPTLQFRSRRGTPAR